MFGDADVLLVAQTSVCGISVSEGQLPQAEQAAEKRPCYVILSEAKNLSSI
jgi:hypothetical protein